MTTVAFLFGLEDTQETDYVHYVLAKISWQYIAGDICKGYTAVTAKIHDINILVFNNGGRAKIMMFRTAYSFILWFLNPVSPILLTEHLDVFQHTHIEEKIVLALSLYFLPQTNSFSEAS